MRELPTINGYTVDMRLKEFRRVLNAGTDERELVTIPFTSPKAGELLKQLIAFAHEVIDTLE